MWYLENGIHDVNYKEGKDRNRDPTRCSCRDPLDEHDDGTRVAVMYFEFAWQW